ncbi:helix-hairpin-helix domain-containing protein [Micromonospora sp. NPDC093277]|uniref:helix-hairpin-helix domain-containing protein n=1 Tax=Micromonospora sp. NPDC093277 TaxID=3364291 RepID=UPI0037FFF227
MSPSFALWLVGILTVVAGLVIWRVLAGGRTTADPVAPIVEGDPATAAGDQEQHATAVDEVPPPAVVTEDPAPTQEDVVPVAETAAPPSTDAAEPAGSAPAEAEQPAAVEAEQVSTETEPVAAEVAPASAPEEVPPATAVAEVEAAPAQEEPTPAAPAAVPAPRASVENDTAAVPTASAVATVVGGPADDFRKIQGIGPKMAAGLQAAGIRTYQQLAELDEAGLREVIKAAGLRAAPGVATWPQQAEALAGADGNV